MVPRTAHNNCYLHAHGRVHLGLLGHPNSHSQHNCYDRAEGLYEASKGEPRYVREHVVLLTLRSSALDLNVCGQILLSVTDLCAVDEIFIPKQSSCQSGKSIGSLYLRIKNSCLKKHPKNTCNLIQLRVFAAKFYNVRSNLEGTNLVP